MASAALFCASARPSLMSLGGGRTPFSSMMSLP